MTIATLKKRTKIQQAHLFLLRCQPCKCNLLTHWISCVAFALPVVLVLISFVTEFIPADRVFTRVLQGISRSYVLLFSLYFCIYVTCALKYTKNVKGKYSAIVVTVASIIAIFRWIFRRTLENNAFYPILQEYDYLPDCEGQRFIMDVVDFSVIFLLAVSISKPSCPCTRQSLYSRLD